MQIKRVGTTKGYWNCKRFLPVCKHLICQVCFLTKDSTLDKLAFVSSWTLLFHWGCGRCGSSTLRSTFSSQKLHHNNTQGNGPFDEFFISLTWNENISSWYSQQQPSRLSVRSRVLFSCCFAWQSCIQHCLTAPPAVCKKDRSSGTRLCWVVCRTLLHALS